MGQTWVGFSLGSLGSVWFVVCSFCVCSAVVFTWLMMWVFSLVAGWLGCSIVVWKVGLPEQNVCKESFMGRLSMLH